VCRTDYIGWGEENTPYEGLHRDAGRGDEEMRMNRAVSFCMGLAVGFLGVLALPAAAATTHTFKVTFDMTLDSDSTLESQPYVFLQNPYDSGGSITVEAVKLQFNDAAGKSTLADGVFEHSDPGSCTKLSSHTLSAGEGITIAVPRALSDCSVFPDYPAACTTGCGSGCREMWIVTEFGMYCTCIPDFGSGQVVNPSRVTVVIDVDAGSNEDPTVRALEIHTVDDQFGNPVIQGISAVEVTAETP
jgi:hypothetical protein